MKFHSINDILAANEAATARFTSEAAVVNGAQAAFRPAESEWTIGEIVEHVNIVNGGFLRITHKLLRQAEADPKPAPADLNLGGVIVNENGEQAPKFEAPETVRPKGGVSIADAVAGIQQIIAGFAEIKPRLEAVDLSEQKFPHPVAGPLSGYQWLILLAEHSDRHLGQIRRVKTSPGFPC
ncbi:MAG: DinB family protein [Acidobacteria bacterium]|nr:DinB family protein [Acidobacteriota bacterium]